MGNPFDWVVRRVRVGLWMRRLRRNQLAALAANGLTEKDLQRSAAREAALPRTRGDDLWEAARDNDVVAVKKYLAAGVPADAPNRFGGTALGVAEDVNVIRTLLEAGANGRGTPGEWTKLHGWVDAACDVMHQLRLPEPTAESMEIIRLLLEHGADPLAHAKDHGTPLDMARKYQCEAVIRMLERHVEERDGA